jgi:hypothetical protein
MSCANTERLLTTGGPTGSRQFRVGVVASPAMLPRERLVPEQLRKNLAEGKGC